MYNMNNKKDAVREIQKYLLEISESDNSDICRISVDGVFGDETKKAVCEFQSEQGLPPTGIVDRLTYDALYAAYKEALMKRKEKQHFISAAAFPFSRGDQAPEVLILHLILNELRREYRDLPRMPMSDYFGKDTERALMKMEKHLLWDEDGILTRDLFERLILETGFIRRNSRYSD